MLQLAIVDQTLLGEGEKATVFANGGLVKDWKKSQRLIVIVTNGENSHALIVYNVKTLPVTHSSDLSIDSVVAIDESFKYDIDYDISVFTKMYPVIPVYIQAREVRCK